MHHYITKYSDDNGNRYAVSWFQILNKCFSIKTIIL